MSKARKYTKKPVRKGKGILEQKKEEEPYIVADYYEIYDKLNKDKPKMIYKQKGNIIKHPARIMLFGPSGYGKTNLLMPFILDLLSFKKLYIFAKNPKQRLFDLIKAVIDKISKKTGEDIENLFHINTEIDYDVKRIQEENDENKNQSLVVFDDMIEKGNKKNERQIDDFLKNGRSANISVIVVAQEFFAFSQSVRENINYVMLFRLRDARKLPYIRTYYADDLTPEEFRRSYFKATKEDIDDDNDDEDYQKRDRNAFLFIDCDCHNKTKKYRRGFVEKSLFSSNNENPEIKYGPINKHPKSINYFNSRYESDSE